ncbi:hypothetical protein AUEXF2481DRAFT_42 [Aureobasidium subglaciale EXF-2481]|uniref:Uncharacterized protein n=1 Tax=Aureobasidium subglaciale (strain EXF-2481) TaxID=1043005 RepID=A0A074Z140_AURSE|nr:uncharacterized protein AUEXF2481DRAFT_42 [Aureobasidium subglaciale EXF-2481]KER00078.1 hypothetical protein AUEXF2481DRAFT_42 [Aureobasidium subglaciale EXF-2481]
MDTPAPDEDRHRKRLLECFSSDSDHEDSMPARCWYESVNDRVAKGFQGLNIYILSIDQLALINRLSEDKLFLVLEDCCHQGQAVCFAQAANMSALQSKLVAQNHTKSALQNGIVAREAEISARDATIATHYDKIVAQKDMISEQRDMISSLDDTIASLREKIGVLQVKENARKSGSSWFK